jgi:PAS domain S-box-containing protein
MNKIGTSHFPRTIIWATIVISVLPFLLQIFGWDFGNIPHPIDPELIGTLSAEELRNAMFESFTGSFMHFLLEWNAVGIAMATAILAFIQYRITGNPTTPIIGMALLCAGSMDAFHALAATKLIRSAADNENFIPFTWALSRIFNVLILMIGASIFVFRSKNKMTRMNRNRFVLSVSAFFLLVSFAVIQVCANSTTIPTTMYPESIISRPFDVLPLILFLIAGIFLFPKFYKRSPGIFSFTLALSILPQVFTQLHMAFGSIALFDHHFNVAHFLKSMAYLVPFAGLSIDYIKTYMDLANKNREVQQFINTLDESAIVSMTDAEGNINYVNDKFCEISGYSQEELLGQNHRLLKSGLQPDGLFIGMWKALSIGKVWRGEILNRKKDGGYYWVDTTINPFKNDKGEIEKHIAVRFDITKQKEQQESLASSNKELEQFAYIASHDLQEPLRTVMSFVDLLKEDYQGNPDEDTYKYLQFISQSTTRMSALIKGLLDYSQLGTEKELSTLDCGQVINEIREDLNARIKETNTILRVDELPQVRARYTELRLLFQNLINNAIKFQKKNIRPEINISAKQELNQWEFAIQDNGIGISPEHVEKIFSIFQRLHHGNVYEGTGIGLAHCQKIVDLLGGKIWVESELDKGSTFYFTIPN